VVDWLAPVRDMRRTPFIAASDALTSIFTLGTAGDKV
jgi:hypothetical protein